MHEDTSDFEALAASQSLVDLGILIGRNAADGASEVFDVKESPSRTSPSHTLGYLGRQGRNESAGKFEPRSISWE